MASILRSELRNLNFPTAAEIVDVKHLSSYNWLGTESPTIVVPGSPALWAPPSRPTQVSKDSGRVYINQNAARHPDSPLEPLFLALYATQPSFDICSTDIVTDRNNLRKLLSFVQPGAEGDALTPFTIEIEIHKGTALFSRVEERNEEHIPPGEFRGFGHEFEKVYTRQQINGSTGHHRIVSYHFAGMNFIVRHETDGYVAGNVNSRSSADEISSVLESLSLDPNPTRPGLIVRREGKTIPLDSTLEIKTRASHRRLSIQEIAPQIWVSQTPKLVRAYHRGGKFEEPQVEDVTSDVRRWQTDNQVQLKRLAALIRKILDIVKGLNNRATVRYDCNGDKLIISPLSGKKMLPEDLYLKWEPEPALPNTAQRTPAVTAQLLPVDQRKLGLSIQVGETTYEGIDLKLMPYFKTYLDAQPPSGQDSSVIPKHPSIEYFDEAVRGLSKGLRQLFRVMPTRLSAHRELCKTLQFLGVNVLEGRTLRHLMDDFRSGKADYDPEERRTISGNKSLARDSAFRLLYMFLSEGLVSADRDKAMAYNAAFFVVSHKQIFRYRARKMVRCAFEDRFGVTYKQQANMDKWPLKDSSGGGSSDEEEETTVSEDYGYSDDADWYY
ncbi:geranylgeranyl pyrophosphate synthetase [Xylaria cf. heliscus]|nr:geranylgeranyl pyrophosphate synthetase [Xylaria cf. heliscus]